MDDCIFSTKYLTVFRFYIYNSICFFVCWCPKKNIFQHWWNSLAKLLSRNKLGFHGLAAAGSPLKLSISVKETSRIFLCQTFARTLFYMLQLIYWMHDVLKRIYQNVKQVRHEMNVNSKLFMTLTILQCIMDERKKKDEAWRERNVTEL